MSKSLDSIEDIIADIKQGKMVIIVDDENRENEGDLVMAAEMVTPEAINFMATHARGLICTPLEPNQAQNLKLNPMVEENSSSHCTAFTVSIDAKENISTGISSHDRAYTIKLLTDPGVSPQDFARPGHVFPLIAKSGGVLERPGHTEAAVDLSKLAGFGGVGVICEIINEDGTMARLDDLRSFAKKFNLKIGSIEDLIKYQSKQSHALSIKETINLPTDFGDFKLTLFCDLKNGAEHLCIYKPDTFMNSKEAPLVRIHSKCLTGDVFASQRCDCGKQLQQALSEFEKQNNGVLLYMDQEGRGIGLTNKIKAYFLQEQGFDTIEANQHLGFDSDLRDYGIAAQMLNQLGLTKIKLMTNNPKKVQGLIDCGIQIEKQVPIEIAANKNNYQYLYTKKIRLGHNLSQFHRH